MTWEEVERGKTWESEKYLIKRGERYRKSAIVPDSVRAMGPDIYHCYEKDEKQNKYIAQASDLAEAKNRLEKLSKK